MSTLSDLVQARTALGPDDVDHLHRLVAEWQLVADLSFADLVLWVRTLDASWLSVAHMRPTTGATTYPEDVVGTTLGPAEAYRLERASRERRIIREGDPEWRGKVPFRQEAVPVRRGDAVVAVLARDTNLSAARMPSPLELAYLTSAGELLFTGAPSQSLPPLPSASSQGQGQVQPLMNTGVSNPTGGGGASGGNHPFAPGTSGTPSRTKKHSAPLY